MPMLVFSLPNSLVMGGSSFTHYFQMWVVMLHMNGQQLLVSCVRDPVTVHTMCHTQEVFVNEGCCMRRCVLYCLISTSDYLCISIP